MTIDELKDILGRDESLEQACHELVTSLSQRSRNMFKKHCLAPAIQSGILSMTIPNIPSHPAQQYYLSDLGMRLLEVLSNDSEVDKE